MPQYVYYVTSQTVAGAAAGPVISLLSDISGRREFLLMGNLLGVTSTVLSATAHDINAMICGGAPSGFASNMRQLGWQALGEKMPNKD